MSKNNIGSRLSEQTTRHVKTNENYNINNRKRLEKIRSERSVKVYGNPLYKTYLGDVYSFDYQDYPVTIQFNGTWQEFPETIAYLLMEKLDKAALSNVAKEVGDGDKL